MDAEYFKNCNLCNRKVVYKNKNSYLANKNKNSPCKLCKHRILSNKLKGKKRPPFGELWIKNMVESHKNSKKWKNSMNTDEYKEKQRLSKLGEKNGRFGKTHTESSRRKMSVATKKRMDDPESIEKLKKRQWTEEQKIKHKIAVNNPNRLKLLREYRLNQIKESGGFPSFNKKSCSFFNFLNEKLSWNGCHALKNGEQTVDGYSIDYFDKENNIIIEWDEKRHKEPRNYKKDLIRQRNIVDNTHGHFYRIDETNKIVRKIDTNCEDFSEMIQTTLYEFENQTEKNN